MIKWVFLWYIIFEMQRIRYPTITLVNIFHREKYRPGNDYNAGKAYDPGANK